MNGMALLLSTLYDLDATHGRCAVYVWRCFACRHRRETGRRPCCSCKLDRGVDLRCAGCRDGGMLGPPSPLSSLGSIDAPLIACVVYAFCEPFAARGAMRSFENAGCRGRGVVCCSPNHLCVAPVSIIIAFVRDALTQLLADTPYLMCRCVQNPWTARKAPPGQSVFVDSALWATRSHSQVPYIFQVDIHNLFRWRFVNPRKHLRKRRRSLRWPLDCSRMVTESLSIRIGTWECASVGPVNRPKLASSHFL